MEVSLPVAMGTLQSRTCSYTSLISCIKKHIQPTWLCLEIVWIVLLNNCISVKFIWLLWIEILQVISNPYHHPSLQLTSQVLRMVSSTQVGAPWLWTIIVILLKYASVIDSSYTDLYPPPVQLLIGSEFPLSWVAPVPLTCVSSLSGLSLSRLPSIFLFWQIVVVSVSNHSESFWDKGFSSATFLKQFALSIIPYCAAVTRFRCCSGFPPPSAALTHSHGFLLGPPGSARISFAPVICSWCGYSRGAGHLLSEEIHFQIGICKVFPY